MRACIFINTSWNILNFRSGLIRGLQKIGFEVHAIAPEDSYSIQLTAMGCIFHPVRMMNTGSNPIQDLDLMRQVYVLYKTIGPQVVLHYTVKPNIYGSLVAGYLGIPSISTISGLGTVFLTSGKTSRIARLLYRRALKYPVRVFFQNPGDLDLFKTKGLLQKNNYHLIAGSGVDIRRFKQTKSPPNFPPFIFLMMARLIEDKGIREYAAAAESLMAAGASAKFRLIGAAEPTHKRSVPEEEIANGPIEYLGETSDVRPFIEDAHAVVLPSYREGLPKSLLEAAAMRKPIITCDVPGCTEVVKDQINGLLCKAGDASDLKAKMEELLSFDQQELAKMGAAGRRRVKALFQEDSIVQVYLDTINQLI
mgnify:CR=1 FL=1